MLSSLGYKIFIDRYALKEYDNFVEGDMVLVHQKGQSTFGTVLSFSDDIISVKLSSDETISCEKSNVAKPVHFVQPQAGASLAFGLRRQMICSSVSLKKWLKRKH